MRGLRWLLVALFVLFSAGVLWACGGDDDEEAGAPTATRSADEAAEGGDTPGAREDGQNGGDGGDTAELIRKFGEATFKATYELSGAGFGEVTEGTMVWYKKGDNLRIDIEGDVEGQTMEATIITRPDRSYLCTKIPELGEEGFCLETPGESAEEMGDIVSDLGDLLGDPDVDVTSTGSREIAGEDTECLRVRSPELETDSEVCLTGDGVPLSMTSTVQGAATSIEATDFTRDVSDDDFEPPYSVSEGFPGLEDFDIDE